MTRQVAGIMRSIRRHLPVWVRQGIAARRCRRAYERKFYRKIQCLLSRKQPHPVLMIGNVPPPRHPSLWLPVGKTCTMKKQKPPSTRNLSHTLLLVGQNSSGQWIVRNQCGSRGGLFVDRANAIKFAMLESGRRPQAVIMVPGVLELDMSSSPNAVVGPASKVVRTELQRAA